jgi:hypothetical protein
MPEEEEQLLFQRQALQSTLAQELVYIAKSKTEVYHTRMTVRENDWCFL